MAPSTSLPLLLFPRLYAIVDADVAAALRWTPEALAGAYLAGGARLLQVRAKNAASGILTALCDTVVARAHAANGRVIVNDRADVARLTGASGVHVGQDDLSAGGARAVLGPDAIVGLSTHTAAQVDAALAQPISYLAVGPVFGTFTKDTGYRAVGLELVRYAAEAVARAVASGRLGCPCPIVGIGGVTLDRAASVIDAGATSVAVIADLTATGNPEGRVRAYLELLESPWRSI